MKKIQLVLIASLLISGMVQAAAPCNGFEVIVKNNLQDNLISTTVTLQGADITPRLVEIDSQSEKTFTIASSDEDTLMSGELVFKTISLPSKTIHIEFDLKNMVLLCEHSDKEIPNVFPVTHTRQLSKVIYNIG